MNLQTLFFLCMLPVSALAQPGVFRVIDISPGVYYLTPGNETPKLLGPGDKLESDCTLLLDEHEKAHLVYKETSLTFTTPGSFRLERYAREAEERTTQRPGLFRQFFQWVYGGVSDADSEKDLERSHEKYITQNKGGTKGFAGGSYGIDVLSPVVGKIQPGAVHFAWRSAGPEMLYDFQLLDYQTEGVLCKALLRDTVFEIDLGKLALEPGRQYYWVVYQKEMDQDSPVFMLADEPSLRSPRLTLVPNEGSLEEVRMRVRAGEDYRDLPDDISRDLMELMVLEDEQYIMAAYRGYEELQQKYPGNSLVDKMLASFLSRQGLLEAAKQQLQRSASH